MGFETERKFLVNGDFLNEAEGKREILQAYLFRDPEKTVRIRISDNEAFITIKSKAPEGSIRRGEWEFQIPAGEAKELLSLCIPGKINKTRYLIPCGDHLFEVDVFHDRNEGLILAELELEDENEDFPRPSWLGQEVTGDPAYFNSNLIK